MFKHFTLDNFNLRGKIVGIRLDINSPIINGKSVYNERIARACKTLRELTKGGAKVVILAHQGRNGKPDCLSLKNHQVLIEGELNKKITFTKDIYSETISKKIPKLKNGEILLLENLRFFDDETNLEKQDNKLDNLFELFDYYIFDAFSVSHRNHKSVIGPKNIPVLAGRSMEREMLHLNKLTETKKPHTYIFGGAKPDDLILLIEKSLEDKSVDKILLSGVIGEMALLCKGYNLGCKKDLLDAYKYIDQIDKFKEIFDKFESKFELPSDVAIFDGKTRIEIPVDKLEQEENQELVKKYLIQDIGTLTINSFEKSIIRAGSVYYKGPQGNFEEQQFEKGTKQILKILTHAKGFTFMGGGHSVTAAKMFNYLKKINYVSLAGGALVQYLSNIKLPVFQTLKDSFKAHEKEHYDFIVLGSNTVDIKVDIPEKLSEIEIGEKIKVKENFKLSNGGGGINVSITLTKLQASVGYLGKLSTEFREVLDKTLTKNKIGLIESKETKRGVAKSILLQTKDKDRVIFTYRGQNDYLELEDFEYKKLNSNNFYLTALNGKSMITQIKLIKLMKKKNKNSIFCYNPSAYLIKEEGRHLNKLIKLIDVLIFNFDEAKDLTGDRDMSSCLRSVYALGPKIVVITDGANGSYAYDGQKEIYQRSKPPKRLVDTTGAGDCFAATFFYFFTKKYGVKASLQYASWNSSALISKNGTSNGLLTFSELAKTKRA
jgi:phosphoglycerate kinase